MTKTITRTDLAELFDAVDMPAAAAYQREQAAADQAEEAERYGELDTQLDILHDLAERAPKPSERGKHDGGCWRTHVGCLAEKVRQVIEGGA